MPPRLNLFTANKAASAAARLASPRLATPIRFRPAAAVQQHRRWNSSRDGVKGVPPDEQTFPTQDQLPDVSEEAAEIDRIMHKGSNPDKDKSCDGTPSSPELEQGTPVSEVLQRDKQAMKHMPKVMQDQFKGKGKGKGGSRSFSTSARSRLPELETPSHDDASAAVLADMIDQVSGQAAKRDNGLKFDPPHIPKKQSLKHQKRYDSMQEQFTKMLMEDGKLTLAQKVWIRHKLQIHKFYKPPAPGGSSQDFILIRSQNMSTILDHLRTAPPPQINSRRPLLGSPTAPQLPLDPVNYLTLIIDSVSPLFRIRQQKGIVGGGASVQVPHPLNERQRRRVAIKWILDSSKKRRDVHFAQRVANELVAVAEGRSGVWDRRDQQHKIGITGRANLGLRPRRRFVANSSPAFPRPTVATSSRHESFELADYPAEHPLLPDLDSADTRAGFSGNVARLFQPFANSQSLAGVDSESEEDWEKAGSSEERRPRGFRSTRLRFWGDALRNLAQTANRTPVDPETAAKMKFSHSIQFNAVPDWSTNYIAYSNLKKLIYSLEKQAHQPDGQATTDVESAPLLAAQSNDPNSVFKRALDMEMDKICSFYRIKQAEIFETTEELLSDAAGYLSETDGVNMDPVSETVIKARNLSSNSRRNTGPTRRRSSAVSDSIADDDGDSDDDHSPSAPSQRRRMMQSTDRESAMDDGQQGDLVDSAFFGQAGSRGPQESHFSDQDFLALYNNGVSLKKRLIEVYVSLCELRSFIELNKTGFSKALKKYDKTLYCSLRRDYLNTVVYPAAPFTDNTMAAVDSNIEKVEGVYADVVTKGNRSLARRELRLHLREHVVWERNTVWREMIEIERRAQAANVGIRQTLLGGDEDPATARRQGDKQDTKNKELRTPLGRIRLPVWLCSPSFVTLVVSIVVFGALLASPVMDSPEQNNCLAMLVLVSILWATEAIPLFVTSLLIPFLVVVLGIMRSDGKHPERLGPKDATAKVFSAMWTPVIMLLLGGFTIAAALSKYDIARRMAMLVLSKAGSRPRVMLLTNMFVSMFLSMWISNVASPVLCYSIIQPLLRNLPSDSNFSKALVLGIALAANVGGAASPIASPQNIIALQNMKPDVSWGAWFFIALPVCIISILLIWVLLLLTFHPDRNTTIVPMRPVKDRFTGVQYFITFVTIATIVLWCASHQLEHVFGDMGVIAIVPLVLFFGTGILNKEDFNNFLWTIIILAAGGLCLGKAVTSSGLLHTIASGITTRVEHFSLYGVLLVFTSLVLVIATFISHTVAALIFLPLVRQIGVGMEDPHPNLLVMASALMCSVAMGLPTSGFPNMTAIMTEVPQTGQRYLQVRHFITRGVPSSLMAYVVIITIGYGLMYVAGL
ncbi:hypothetical protein NUU61_009290 [Penicillium alfredii]|uniref:SPX domain-containing protein n=1 Tax=Penicillium alfredii TaxID=1506179 RepID=A0A9W9EMV0_9EURO|nr:uncharacterized protein NUU61_009290 [Penicillium alfredii]KAJ5084711.1 hypothetical protein NUU61_009290 [Penicillium alfredii]